MQAKKRGDNMSKHVFKARTNKTLNKTLNNISQLQQSQDSLTFSLMLLVPIIVFLLILTLTTPSLAVENATISAGDESSYNASVSAGNTAVTAGGTTQVNINSVPSTSRWAGFYGSITATIVLADASNNWFKNWTVSDVSGSIVYASTETIIDWDNLSPANQTSDFPSWLTSDSADNWQNTFNNNETHTFNGQSLNVNYTFTYDNAGTNTFKTYCLKDTNSKLLWAALAQNDATGYNGGTVDYQLLVPVNGATPITYYFYFELP